MKSIAYRITILASLFSLAAGFGTGPRPEPEGKRQASVIYNAPSRAPILGQVWVEKNDSGFTQFTSIELPGASRTSPNGINNRGQIVGNYFDTRSHGFLLESRGQVVGFAPWTHYLGYLYSQGVLTWIAFPSSNQTLAFDINDRGQIVGNYRDEDFKERGFVAE